MKKKFLRRFLCALLTLMLIAALSVSAFAESDKSAEENGDGGFFAALYEGVSAHLGEIFCALSLAGSLLIAFAYKKGLLPIISRALSSLGSSVGGLKESTESFLQDSRENENKITDALDCAKGALEGFGEALSRLERDLAELKNEKERSERIELIMNSQVDMLYDLFMSSALPQYQKDAVAKRIGEMKAYRKDAVTKIIGEAKASDKAKAD